MFLNPRSYFKNLLALRSVGGTSQGSMSSVKGYLRVSEKGPPRDLSELEAGSEVGRLTSWNILEGLFQGLCTKSCPVKGVIPGLLMTNSGDVTQLSRA